MEEAHTSDTLDTDFLLGQASVNKMEENLSVVYSIQDDHQMISQLLQKVTIDKPLSLYRLLQQLQNQRTNVLYKTGQLISSDSPHISKYSEQETQQYIRVQNDQRKNGKNRNTFLKSEVKNIYQQHNYEGVILKELTSLYSGQGCNDERGGRMKQEGDQERRQCGNSLLSQVQQNERHSLVGHSDKSQYQYYNYQQTLQQSQAKYSPKASTFNTSTQLFIVTKSLQSVQCLLTKLSQFRQHSKTVRQKIKQSKFKIDKLYKIKQRKKEYLAHLMNVKTIMQTKLSALSQCEQDFQQQKQQQTLRKIQQMTMKYQYSPYVFLNNTLQTKLFGIIKYRIDTNREIRLMNLNGKMLLRLLQQFIPKLLTMRESSLYCENGNYQSNNKLTLTLLTRNLLKLIMHLKPDSYQCIDTKSSTYLHEHYESLLQQHYIALSLNQQLTSTITLQEFTKVGSMMQFSPISQKIYNALKYVWLRLYYVGLECVYSIFWPLLKTSDRQYQQQSSYQQKQLFQRSFSSSFCVGITNNKLHEHYGRIEHTLKSIKEMLLEFQPKYAWCYRFVGGRNARLRKCSVGRYEQQQIRNNTKNCNNHNNTPLNTVCMYLINSLLKQVAQYHTKTTSRIQGKLMFDYVFGNRINTEGKTVDGELLAITKSIIVEKEQGQISKNRKTKSTKDKKKGQKKDQIKSSRINRNNIQRQYTTPNKKRKINSKSAERYNNHHSLQQQQQYDSPQSSCSVQFRVMQRVELQKMLVFDCEGLRTVQQDQKVETVEREIVQLLQKISELGETYQEFNYKINYQNILQQYSTHQQPTASSSIIKSLLQQESSHNNNVNNCLYHRYQQQQTTNEVRQFQTVLLKLIIQSVLQRKQQQKLNDCLGGEAIYIEIQKMDSRVKCSEMIVSVMNSILLYDNDPYQLANNNTAKITMKQLTQEITTLQSLILNVYQHNHSHHSNIKMLQQRLEKVVHLVTLSVQEGRKTKQYSNIHNDNNDSGCFDVIANHKQSVLLMQSMVIKLLILIEIFTVIMNNRNKSHSNKLTQNNNLKNTNISSTNNLSQQESILKTNKKSFFGNVFAKITKQKKSNQLKQQSKAQHANSHESKQAHTTKNQAQKLTVNKNQSSSISLQNFYQLQSIVQNGNRQLLQLRSVLLEILRH